MVRLLLEGLKGCVNEGLKASTTLMLWQGMLRLVMRTSGKEKYTEGVERKATELAPHRWSSCSTDVQSL